MVTCFICMLRETENGCEASAFRYVACCICDVQIYRTNGQWYWAEYSTFSISDEAGKYRLTVDGYSGDAGDAMAASYISNFNANGRMFSTPESDNDICPCNCAGQRIGGWWFGWCSVSYMNSLSLAIWKASYPAVGDVQTSRMMVKVD